MDPRTTKALDSLDQQILDVVSQANEKLLMRARIQKLEAILEEIKDEAEENYDGPEDKRWGRVLSLCRNALWL